jgi:tubulin epsilon
MRFEGPLNIDLNEITTTLVPFPRLRFLQARRVIGGGLSLFLWVNLTVKFLALRFKTNNFGCATFMCSMSPLFGTTDLGSQGSGRGIDAMFVDAFSRGRQLVKGDPKKALHLACGLMLRGDVVVSDINRNVDRLRKDLRMVSWNEYG